MELYPKISSNWCCLNFPNEMADIFASSKTGALVWKKQPVKCWGVGKRVALRNRELSQVWIFWMEWRNVSGFWGEKQGSIISNIQKEDTVIIYHKYQTRLDNIYSQKMNNFKLSLLHEVISHNAKSTNQLSLFHCSLGIHFRPHSWFQNLGSGHSLWLKNAQKIGMDLF